MQLGFGRIGVRGHGVVRRWDGESRVGELESRGSGQGRSRASQTHVGGPCVQMAAMCLHAPNLQESGHLPSFRARRRASGAVSFSPLSPSAPASHGAPRRPHRSPSAHPSAIRSPRRSSDRPERCCVRTKTSIQPHATVAIGDPAYLLPCPYVLDIIHLSREDHNPTIPYPPDSHQYRQTVTHTPQPHLPLELRRRPAAPPTLLDAWQHAP